MAYDNQWAITARGGHTVFALPAHLVFATNYRRGALDEAILRCCQAPAGITHGRVTTFRDGAHSMGKTVSK